MHRSLRILYIPSALAFGAALLVAGSAWAGPDLGDIADDIEDSVSEAAGGRDKDDRDRDDKDDRDKGRDSGSDRDARDDRKSGDKAGGKSGRSGPPSASDGSGSSSGGSGADRESLGLDRNDPSSIDRAAEGSLTVRTEAAGSRDRDGRQSAQDGIAARRLPWWLLNPAPSGARRDWTWVDEPIAGDPAPPGPAVEMSAAAERAAIEKGWR